MAEVQIRFKYKLAGRGGTGLVAWGPYMVPKRYEAEIDDPRWSFLVKIVAELVDDRYVCRETTFTAREGVELKGTERVPLAGIIRHTAPLRAMRKVGNGVWEKLPDEGQVLEEFYAAFRKQERSGGREPITDERLDEVAEIYRANEDKGSPSKAVAIALDISDSYARALVARARDAKKLAPVPPKAKKRSRPRRT